MTKRNGDAEVSSRGPREERGVLMERVLDAARSLFATTGYAATSLRMVADRAEVDVALVSYYFANKAGLLEAALELPPTFSDGVATATAAPLAERGEAILTTHLKSWDDPRTSDIMRVILVTAVGEPAAMDRTRMNYSSQLLSAISAQLSDDERDLRAGLVASQMIGLALLRYVWRVGELAEASSDRVKRLVAPVIQNYLTGPL